MTRAALMMVVVLGLACGPPASGPAIVKVSPPPRVEATPGPREPSSPKVVPTGAPAETFALARGDYRAELRIWPAGEGRIRFALEVEADPPGGRCTGLIEGDGQEHPQAHLGAESRELDGEAVFVDQYYYETRDCSLSVLVDGDHRHAWVEVSECSIQAEACPYGDVGVLARIAE